MAFEEEILELQDINSLEEKVQKIPLVANENDTASSKTREASFVDPTISPNWEPNPQNPIEELSLELDLDIPEKVIPPSELAESELLPPPGPSDKIESPVLDSELAADMAIEQDEQTETVPNFKIDAALAETLSSYVPIPGQLLEGFRKTRQEEAKREAAQKAEQEKTLLELKERMKAIEHEIKPTTQPALPPLPKNNFTSWKRQLKPRQLPKLSEKTFPAVPAKPVKSKVTKAQVSEIAKRSLEDQFDISSETLAELLVKQELYPKAIDMYERLKLKFPQKSVYFAGKIEELIKLM